MDSDLPRGGVALKTAMRTVKQTIAVPIIVMPLKCAFAANKVPLLAPVAGTGSTPKLNERRRGRGQWKNSPPCFVVRDHHRQALSHVCPDDVLLECMRQFLALSRFAIVHSDKIASF